MSDKFLAMMLEREREAEKLAKANWGHVYITDAADWRAMREAWVAMVEALKSAKTMIEGGIEREFRKTKAGDAVRAALTKARVK